MDERLKDRVAVITGGSSGIGRATALRFANAGAKIVIADLKSGGTEGEITDKHGKDRAIFVKCDVTQEKDIESLFQEAVKWARRLDISCHFAGIAVETTYDKPKRAHEMDVKDYDFLYSINERGVWLCCKYALKQMLEQEPREANARGDRARGWIINAASMLGLIAGGSAVSTLALVRPANVIITVETAPAYVPSKHAVVGMTRQMAIDYAQDRIHVNCLCPGYVDSPFLSKLTYVSRPQNFRHIATDSSYQRECRCHICSGCETPLDRPRETRRYRRCSLVPRWRRGVMVC